MKIIQGHQSSHGSEGIESVRERLEEWRKRREPGSRIPEELWDSAAEAAREQGVTRTCRALRLEYNRLKERCQGLNRGRSNESNVGPGFVEVVGAAWPAVSGWSVELEDGRGGRMRIEVKGAGAPDAGCLSEAFWRARR